MIENMAKTIDLVSPAELIPHPKNMHEHSAEQIARLCKLIEYQGFRNPLVIQKGTGLVVAGHGRLEAAKQLNIEKVPVTYQEFESEEQLYAYMVSDNAIGKDTWATLDLGKINQDFLDLGPDLDIEMLGLKDFEIEPLDKLEPQTDEDAVPEIKGEPVTKRGDIWLLGNHRVMCGDSTMIDDVDKLMKGEKADMVFTDPPYGLGIDGQKESIAKNPKHSRKAFEFKGWDGSIPSEDFFQILHGLNIPSVVFGGNYMTEFLPASKGWIFWNKGQEGQLTMSDGELAWTNQNKALRSVTVNRAAIGKSVHPTQKPLRVVEFCLNYINDSKSVLDFFLGSGSTLIACEKTDRKCYGMELDEHYCDVIVKRWEEYTGKKATLESTREEFKEVSNA